MLFKASEEYIKYLNPLINDITKEFIKNCPDIKLKSDSILFSKIVLGKIKYENGCFKGYFTTQLEKELESIGAIKERNKYYIEYDKLPNDIKQIINNSKKNVNKYKKKIIKYLETGFVLSLKQSNYIDRFINEFVIYLEKNFNKDIDKTYLKQKYINILNKGINDTIKKTKEYIKEKDFANSREIISKITSSLNFYIKDKILNETNKLMFETQKEECLEEGYDSFYWWHTIEKKPSDRQYHRKHFEDSKKGKRFSFDNLPTWNGEPDYPGKLWNCKCRAYVFRNEFLKNC